MNGQIHAPTALHPGKPAGTLAPQNRSERFGEQKKSCAWTISNPGAFLLTVYVTFVPFVCLIFENM